MSYKSAIYYKESSFAGNISDWFVSLKAVSRLLKNVKEWVFKTWIPWVSDRKDSEFKEIFSEESADIEFLKFSEKRINPNDLHPWILIQKENKIPSNGLKATHRYPYATSIYWKNWEHIWRIKKWDEVVLDINNWEVKSYSTLDKKTGKYMAYVRILWTIEWGNVINTSIGFIRAPWLDHRVNPVKKGSEGVNTKKESAELSFDGYYATNGEIIPAYILKAISINYFWKTIYPQVQNKLVEWLNKKRAEITQEVLSKWVSIRESTVFPSYQVQLSRVSMYEKIGKAYKNGEDILKNWTVVSFIQQVQKKPEWQKILQQASIVYQKKKRWF